MKSTLIALTVLLLSINPAWAAKQAQKSYPLELEGVSHLAFSHSVGTINLKFVEPNQVNTPILYAQFKTKNKSWFGKKVPAEQAEMEFIRNNNKLLIQFDTKNVEADLVLELPNNLALTQLSMHMEVGNIQLHHLNTAANIQVEVGNVKASSFLGVLGSIQLQAEVGNTKISGLKEQESIRNFTSMQTKARGLGNQAVLITTEVGNISLKLY